MFTPGDPLGMRSRSSRLTAQRHLEEMAELGILRRIKVGRKYYYIYWRFMELLSE